MGTLWLVMKIVGGIILFALVMTAAGAQAYHFGSVIVPGIAKDLVGSEKDEK